MTSIDCERCGGHHAPNYHDMNDKNDIETRYARLVELSAYTTLALEDVRLERDCLRADLLEAKQAGTPYARQQHDLNALTVALQESERKLKVATEHLAECNAVCLCGCSYSDHEEYSDDGEDCGMDGHNCLRTTEAIMSLHVELISLLRKALPVLDETARQVAGSPDARSGLASFIRTKIGTGQPIEEGK